jgi:hypothetical protein
MTLRLLATPLLAATLLLSALGCSRKDDPALLNTGSYKLDGTTINCQSKAFISSATSGGLSYDYLEIDLTTTPQPASGVEVLKLYYQKPAGQPTNAYILNTLELSTKGSTFGFANNVSRLNSTIGGGFAGTFSATAYRTTTAPPYSNISDGEFVDARP